MSESINTLKRRDALRLLGAMGVLGLSGCNGSGSSSTTTSSSSASSSGTAANTATSTSTSTAGSCVLTATETEGPYPLLAILSNSSIVRQDITEGKTGVPLTLTLTLEDSSNNCAAISGAAIYIWHCDKDGVYSGYSGQTGGVDSTGDTFLRGIQVTDSNGQVTFTTIYPGWYAGRITHIHVQVYINDKLTVSAIATTQLAFPLATTTAVYNSSLYSAHGQNTSVTSFAADNVFSDGTSTEMLSISGDTSAGYTASMTIGIAG
jgi:protocatechuate 3,4-dioxygenase beta subunit